MDILQQFYDNIRQWIPTGVTLFFVLVVIFAVRLFLEKKYSGSIGHHFRRQVITLLLSLLGLLLIIMIIPIDHQPRGQLLSLIGLILSAAIALSSTTFLGNIMAGLMIRALRNFRPGNFIRVGDYFGRVSDQGLFHVEIQGEDRDLTTLPNLYLVTNPVKVIRASGTIISAEVSLGYDVHRSVVERLLREAAEEAELQEPFVRVLDLGDFSVSYRISGLLTKVRHIISARSRLREMMLDTLHKNGIEIVSPTFMNTRDMPDGRHFIPKTPVMETEEPDQSAPEDLVFDKAEQAESIEKLKEYFEKVGKNIESLKKRREQAESDKVEGEIDDEIDKLGIRRKRLADIIERREQEQNSKTDK